MSVRKARLELPTIRFAEWIISALDPRDTATAKRPPVEAQTCDPSAVYGPPTEAAYQVLQPMPSTADLTTWATGDMLFIRCAGSSVG